MPSALTLLLPVTTYALHRSLLTKEAEADRFLVTSPRFKQDCFKISPITTEAVLKSFRKKHTHKHSGFLQRANGSNPGAGMGEIVPFETVLKDGYSFQRCFKDSMYYTGDKFDGNKHDYSQVANVSIVHYTAVVPKEDRKKMTPEVCFMFCRTIPDMFNFGLLNGRECYCTPWAKPMAGESSTCDSPCPGDPKQMCGGQTKSSIYEMHMCAETEGDLKDALEGMQSLRGKLDEAAESLKQTGEQGQRESEQLQLLLGMMGDHTGGQNFQAAKVEAGVLIHLAEDAEAISMKMGVLAEDVDALLFPEDAEDSELLQEPDFTDNDVVVKAEKLTKRMKQLIKDGDAMIERISTKMALQEEVLTEKGAEMAANRSEQYYDAYYFVRPEPKGEAWVHDKSTCGGDLVVPPLFGLTKDECAYACDQHMREGCQAFNWLSKGAGICFLFSSVGKMTQYDMCAKPLEGECKPIKLPNAANETSFAQTKSTPFPFTVKSLEPNSTLFKESVTGMCTNVYGCSGVPAEEVVSDCSLMSDYACRGNIRRPKIEEKEDGTLAMSFSGSVRSGQRADSCAVNPEYCGGCKKYSTCAGPYLETDEVEIKQGDVASYTWTSSGATDNYEVFVGLYSKTCGLVDYQFQRGEKQEWKTFELFAPKTDKYYMKFMLGSYDGTGGGAVGADMQVKEVKQTKASVPRDVPPEGKCMLKLSKYAGLSVKPDKSGQCKHCLKEATKKCLKPDGSFPTPETYDKLNEE